MSRIVIEDLPNLESLTEEQLAEIFGAGRSYRRLGFQMLEDRKMCTANSLASNLQAAATNVGTYVGVAATAFAEHDQISISTMKNIENSLSQMNNAVSELTGAINSGQLSSGGQYADQLQTIDASIQGQLNSIAPIPQKSDLQTSFNEMTQSLEAFNSASLQQLQEHNAQLHAQSPQQSPETAYNLSPQNTFDLLGTQTPSQALQSVLPPVQYRETNAISASSVASSGTQSPYGYGGPNEMATLNDLGGAISANANAYNDMQQLS